ncbi:bacteriocin [Chryseobacterium sp. JK1]|uniref:bacteriocin n=1 Tax=Chryseobacterium sp. JK1 TaxID=874294 RepID=UPI003D6936CF
MNKEIIYKGRKLNKKELNTIQGGRRICIPPGTTECAYYGKFCGEPECQVPPILN